MGQAGRPFFEGRGRQFRKEWNSSGSDIEASVPQISPAKKKPGVAAGFFKPSRIG